MSEVMIAKGVVLLLVFGVSMLLLRKMASNNMRSRWEVPMRRFLVAAIPVGMVLLGLSVHLGVALAVAAGYLVWLEFGRFGNSFQTSETYQAFMYKYEQILNNEQDYKSRYGLASANEFLDYIKQEYSKLKEMGDSGVYRLELRAVSVVVGALIVLAAIELLVLGYYDPVFSALINNPINAQLKNWLCSLIWW